MGYGWNKSAIEGLFKIMLELEKLGENTLITHPGNIYDTEGKKFLTEFANWQNEI